MNGPLPSKEKIDPLTERLRFLRPTAKYKFGKDQYYMVGEVMHEAAGEIERLQAEHSILQGAYAEACKLLEGSAHEPCPAHSHPGCPHCHPGKTVPQLSEQFVAACESGAWKTYIDVLAKIVGASQPPDPEQISPGWQAALTRKALQIADDHFGYPERGDAVDRECNCSYCRYARVRGAMTALTKPDEQA